jgi:esterase/lipase superfamily enzyme
MIAIECKILGAFLALGCCSCVGRPLQGVLIPTTESMEGTTHVAVLIATTRQRATDDAGQMFNRARSSTTAYAEIVVSIPPQDMRETGAIQWPISPPGDPHRHFVTLSAERLDQPHFNAALAAVAKGTRRNNAMIFVHGFKNRFDDAVYRLAQIVQDSGAPVIPVLFSWPSLGVVGLRAYEYDRESAGQSSDSLEDLIDTVSLSPSVREVTILCHSMGCLVALSALQSRAMRTGSIGAKIKNVLLVAPDVNVNAFCEQMQQMGTSRPRSVAGRSRAEDIQLNVGRCNTAWRRQSRRGAIQERFQAREGLGNRFDPSGRKGAFESIQGGRPRYGKDRASACRGSTIGGRNIWERLMSKSYLSVSMCALALVFAQPVFAQTQPVRVGGLTCDTGPRVGLLIGSKQRMNCVFRSNATGQQYRYTGRITRLGLDVGITGGGRLFWGVFAPTSHIGPGALRGTYVGASGNASLGLGLGANVLVGGSNRTISLQPLSVEGQVGVNLALGVAGLTLQ